MKVLMVCLGNICRSPIAEGVLQQKVKQLGLDWEVDSAGTNGFHNGERPHDMSQMVSKLNGIDISGQRSRPFRAEDFEQYDLIIPMAADVWRDIKYIGKKNTMQQKWSSCSIIPFQKRIWMCLIHGEGPWRPFMKCSISSTMPVMH